MDFQTQFAKTGRKSYLGVILVNGLGPNVRHFDDLHSLQPDAIVRTSVFSVIEDVRHVLIHVLERRCDINLMLCMPGLID